MTTYEERKRTIDARIERLEERLRRARLAEPNSSVVSVIAGILDLLKDELR